MNLKEVKISTAIPEVFYECNWRFGVQWGKVVITYGDTIYSANPNLPQDIIIHEATHIKQQKAYGDPKLWWDKYLEDKKFRYFQEIEAYENQAKYLRATINDVRKRLWTFNNLWRIMSGSYGGMITYQEAKRLIPLFRKE
jgi:hypothetical protein